jgi:chromosome segregation ATPase
LDPEFIFRVKERDELRGRVKELFEESAEQLSHAASRLRLAAVSWTWLRDELKQIESELDSSSSGDQTLGRLLAGLRAQIESHGKTGIFKTGA